MNPIARRQFLLAALTVPLVAEAREERTRPYRIGVLGTASPTPFAESLAPLGYVEGRDIVIEVRNIEGRIERLDAMAAELVRLKVDLIVAPNPSAVLSARRATRTIPIVMMHTPDPVALGLVESLAAPGGNVTGVTTLSADLSLKQMEILKEAVARLSRIALLWNPDNPWHPTTVRLLRGRGGPIGLQVRDVDVRGPAAFDGAYATAAAEGAQAMLVLADPMTFFHRRRLAELALHHRLPTMCGLADYVEAGCLMSYWADTAEIYRRTASYIDRLLKGAKPAELPIEQPTKFELVVNLKTARALGIRIPQAILVRADRLID